MKKTVLAAVQARSGAQFIEHQGWEIATDYGDRTKEYQAVRSGVGIIDLSHRGRIEITGKNRIQFLQGLVSNDIKTLKTGTGVIAAFLNVSGRVLADCFIYAVNDSFLIDTAAPTRERIYQSLAKFSPAGEFNVNDVTETTAFFSLQGPHSIKLLASLGARAVYNLNELEFAEIELAGKQLIALRNSRTGEEGFDLFVTCEQAVAVYEALLAGGAQPVGLSAFDLLRLEAGIPEYGIDIDETVIALEAGLERAISFTKGCYLGQETIAKIHYRGHDQTAKKLAGLVIEGESAPPIGAKIYNKDGKEIGHITSAARSPVVGKPIALAYLKRDNFTPGQEHTVEIADQRVIAKVTALPFYRKAAV
ncbi:MAG: aminomethyltransferase family protein [Acidobacteriota bacterium]